MVAYKNAKELKILAYRFGCLDAKGNTKQQNAESIVRSMMLTYTLNNSVMYPFFRSDKQATEFRDWLDEFGGKSEQLPEDAFNNAEAFRKTSVRTRIVTITK